MKRFLIFKAREFKMPNWCSNIITIQGTPEALQSLTATIINTDSNGQKYIKFTQTVPCPDDVQNWYEWNCNNWGTKWDIDSDQELKIDADAIHLTVRTAWSPPIEWASAIVKKYPGLSVQLAYCELGMGYYGVFIADTKKTTHNDFKVDDESYIIDDESGIITPQGSFAKFVEEHGFEDYGG